MPLELPDFDFPGVNPSRQKRSRETTAALLRAGAEMLRVRNLDELSIIELCNEVDVTVGAFYSRFESKEAYFNTLLGLAARDASGMLARLMQNDDALRTESLDDLCRILVTQMISWIRSHEGVLRAALQHNDTRPTRWNTFKELARKTAAAATPPLLRAMGGGRIAAKTRTIAFGFQVTFGTLVNAVLNDPGPLSIHDREMIDRLSQCLLLVLQSEVMPSAAKIPQRKGRARK